MNDDKNLTASDVQTLASRDAVVAFFATLGYNTDSRQPQSAAAMGVAAESLKRQIEHVERIAVHSDGAEPLDVYLIELKSVTVAATKGLATALKNRAGNYLLVLTDDYQRLDFVLLERLLPEGTASPFLTKQVTVRPRILTVDRRNPSLVQLRVLRRFTYTEADSDAQFDKLLSAYAVADWSEPLFNNRALFSDYYLKERLPELDEWAQRPEATYHQLRKLLADDVGPGKGPTTVKSLLEPALQALGFSLTPASGDGEPDYRLYDPANPEKPVATCLAYTWNRKLDGRDDERDTESPEENPGARVVTVIESGEPPWAIVTNGKLWRLYSAQTHSRSTNYYEIDLEETLAMDDPNLAFRYFWLFFRPNAFTTREVVRDGRSREMCFLDQLLDDSEAYAKKLGDRLKQRVFEQILPHFAEGFIEHLKGQADMAGDRQRSLLPAAEQLALKREPDEEFRRQTFQATLTLLYRLLFLLYAESRDLLPVKERRGYFEQSLTNLKQEIAERAGAIEDEVAGRLGKAYSSSPDATELIVPMGLLADKFTEQLRRRMLTDGILRSVVAFPHKDNPRNRVFFEAKLSTCVYVVEKDARIDQPFTVSFYPGRSFEDASRSSALRVAEIAEIDPESLSIPNMTARDLQRWKAIRSCRRVTTWGNAAKCYLGELMTNAKNWHLTSSEPIGPRLLRGANINRYVLLHEPKQGEPLYLRETDFLHEYAKDGRINHHRRIRIGFQESSPIDNWRRLIACVIPAGHYCVHKIRYFSDESRYDLFALLALFNSEMSDWRFSMTSTNNSVNEYEVNALPIPRFNRIDASDIQVERQFWMNLLMVDCAGSIVEWESAVLDEIRNTPARSEVWPDAIHDALSASGKELTKLRGSRQDLIEDFAEWLFTTLRVDRARFSGRSRLRGGQADIDQQDPEWLMRMLTSNRRACGVDPLSIRKELFERFDHLTTQIRRYNAKFEALDKATDRIVWQLVGLNPDGSVGPKDDRVQEMGTGAQYQS